MKTTIAVYDKIKRDVEVEFPIYRRHIVDYGTFYTRTTLLGNGMFYSVSLYIADDRIEMERELLKGFDSFDIDYNLGRGEYESSALQFKAALQEFEKFVEVEIKEKK